MTAELTLEPYRFQNIYMITTYRCNWDCDFCLFKHNKEEEASIVHMLSQLAYSIDGSDKPAYLKITGGEPFLCPDLLRAVFALCRLEKESIYKVGIGTNGSIPLPDYFRLLETPINIFLSRHTYPDELPSVYDLKRDLYAPSVQFRINCNLIRGQVDTLDKMKEHMRYHAVKSGVDQFTFRELNHVTLEDNLFYPRQIYGYVDYYQKHLVPVAQIEEEMARDPEFELSRITGNAYDTNRWYWWNRPDAPRVSVKFRIIDEQKLVNYNRVTEGVDEYVIHPDGTLTGCWDKDLKLIRR